MVQRYLHPQHHNLGALEQCTKPSTAPRALQHKWLPTAPDVCSQCVFTAVCVHFVWVKCRAQLPSMGNYTWPHVMSCHFCCHFHFHWSHGINIPGGTRPVCRPVFYVAYLTARFVTVSK